MKNIIFIAPPAAGKGTQAKLVSTEYNIPHISTGDLLREEMTKGSEIGISIKKDMESGNLVSDEVITTLLKNRITSNDCLNGFILDGYPRNIEQAKEYDGPVLIHVLTKKGKGYKYAEGDKYGEWHGIGPFDKETGKKLFEQVLETSKKWGNEDNMMYVVGATKANMLQDIRAIIPNNFLLVPGVGAQGGSLEAVAEFGMNDECGLLVNSSRAIIYADSTENFAEAARAEALKVQQEMDALLTKKGI